MGVMIFQLQGKKSGLAESYQPHCKNYMPVKTCRDGCTTDLKRFVVFESLTLRQPRDPYFSPFYNVQ